MRAKEKLLALVTTGILLTILLIPVKANAALQANGSGTSTKTFEQWINQIRKMEVEGGTLGLTGSGSLNQQLGKDESNNLDIHMQKNTEYGAMAILSASNYGKSTPVHEVSDGSLSTTTGNKSGVYMKLNKERVAGGTLNSYKDKINAKYINWYAYKNSGTRKIGDATIETSGWHNTGTAVSASWFEFSDYSFLRAYSGSIFSFCGYGSLHGYYWEAWNNYSYPSRAVVVVGEGF